MIKCAIVDDEHQAVSILKEFISEIPELHLVKFSTNEIELLSYLQSERVDILFLDVDMPKISGIEFIKLVKKLPSPPFFVLTTAHPQYAVQGFEHDVSDYLLKPIAFDRFYKAVQKVMLQINARHKDDHEAKSYFFVKVD